MSNENVETVLEVDALLFAAGRQPNVDHLGLEAAGVNFNSRDGIYADKFLRTSNPNIYAVGDCIAMALKPEKDSKEHGPGY